jgi:hypothetical protein
MSMLVGVLAKLVVMAVLAVPSTGTLSTAHVRTTLPRQIMALTVVCNPAWGTIVLPICV